MKYKHGSIKDNPKYRGWITGSFYPPNTVNYDKNVEIKVDYLSKGKSVKPHYHKERKTWIIVLNGKMHMKIDGKKLDIKSGEYIIFEPGVVEELISTAQDTIAISIHTPSSGDDKVEVK